jgi:hypothetical protein
VVHYHLAHVPIHLQLVLAHQLIKSQIAAGRLVKLGEDFVVFQTQDGGDCAGWTTGEG